MIDIREATRDEVRAHLGFMPAGMRDIFAAFDGDRTIGICGVMRDPAYFGTILEDDGRWIAFLDLAEGFPLQARIRAVLAIAHYLKQFGDDVWVYCDHHKHPTAERLLTAIGFSPTDEIRPNWRDPKQKVRMWQWQG